MTDTYLRLEGYITRFILNTAALLLLVSVSMTFYQVVTRFVFDEPSTWSEVMARSLMIWAVFLACAAGFRYGAMISVEVVFHFIPRTRHIWLHSLTTALILLFLFLLAWFGYQMTLRVADQDVALIYVSMSWFYAALPVGSIFSILSIIGRYLEILQRHRSGSYGADESQEVVL